MSIVDIHLRKLLWVYCLGHAGVKGNNRADRLAGKVTITSGLLLGRYEVLRSLRHYLRVQSQGHHTTDRLEERGVERGSARRSSLKGRERAIINQTNIGTVSKAALGKLLRETHMGFSERIDTILNSTEVFLQMTKLIIEVVYGARNALLLYKSYYFSSLIIIQVSSSGDPVRITGR